MTRCVILVSRMIEVLEEVFAELAKPLPTLRERSREQQKSDSSSDQTMEAPEDKPAEGQRQRVVPGDGSSPLARAK